MSAGCRQQGRLPIFYQGSMLAPAKNADCCPGDRSISTLDPTSHVFREDLLMPRIEPISREQADPQAQQVWDDQIASHGRMTNMKRTLARSGPALAAYMQWYPLRQEIAPFLGERLTNLFAHAISTQTDCLICGTFFRRILIDAGENPDELKLDDREQLVVEFGRQIAKDAWGVSEPLFARLQSYFNDDEILKLTAFAGLMVATNIINTLHVELDDYLAAYRSKESHQHGSGT
mgnify:CR=1 FL=1